MRGHARWFNADPGRIAILGESASGQRAAQVASTPCAGCQVQAVVSFYGVYDFAPWSRRTGSTAPPFWRLDLDHTEAVFADRPHVSRSLPPTLLIQGTGDELYGGTVRDANRLHEAGAIHRLVLLKGGAKTKGLEGYTFVLVTRRF